MAGRKAHAKPKKRSRTGTAASAPSAGAVEAYLASLEPAQRAALERLRRAVLSVAPEATEGMSYGMPALKLDGHGIAGFAAFKGHLSYFPMSGTALDAVDTQGFRTSKSTLQFTLDKPLPLALVKKVVRARIAELKGSKGR